MRYSRNAKIYWLWRAATLFFASSTSGKPESASFQRVRNFP